MEIYRTDGGGKSFTNERLFKLVRDISQNTEEDFFEDVKIIRDHKGVLMIKIIEEHKNSIEYIYSVFLVFWHKHHDYHVSIYKKNTCVYGSNVGYKW